jgi:ferrous iron transport protein B
MTLFDLNEGDKAYITKVIGRGAFRKRILEMGFIPGKEIRVVKKAPLKDPTEYSLMGYNVSLRNSEAKYVEIETNPGIPLQSASKEFQTFNEDTPGKQDYSGRKIINVALVGNPNSGKTTLFNFASGSKERVGNYSGVTVDAKEATIRSGDYVINFIDLPGTYSLSAYSPEELFVRNHIIDHHPDIVLNVIDSSNLERNLYLTTQLIDLDVKMIIALNMYDELLNAKTQLDYNRLGKLIGIPVIPTIGSKGKGIDRLISTIIEVFDDRNEIQRHIHINYGEHLEDRIANIQKKIKIPENYVLTDQISSRFLAIKLMEKDMDAISRIAGCSNGEEILTYAARIRNQLELDNQEDAASSFTDAKYGFIEGALRETLKPSVETKVKKSEVIDTFLTHKLWGIPIFIFLMWLSFYSTFKLGEYPKAWISEAINYLTMQLEYSMTDGMLKDLIIQGIIGGVGGVIVFLPNILILFLFISLMEDTGYMARAAFIMDKAMHKIGLHGKSFIPLLMGFGCNVPAILSTRIIESRRDRMVTMLINPFMSCSARLPVYILLIGAFFHSYQGTVLFAVYIFGILIAIFSALLLNRTFFRKADIPFVMELPPYRMPTMRSLVKHMWFRTEQYLKKIAGIILIASIIIWALGYFPVNHDQKVKFNTIQQIIGQQHKQAILATHQSDSLKINELTKRFVQRTDSLKMAQIIYHQENSFIGRIGKAIHPVMKPLGFDWKMTIAILTGIAGKEIVVGTMGVLYSTHTAETRPDKLVSHLQNEKYSHGELAGQYVFNPVVAFSFMMFILIYFPCIAVIAAIRKESGQWKWALFMIFYSTTLAWIISFVVYQTGKLFFL